MTAPHTTTIRRPTRVLAALAAALLFAGPLADNATAHDAKNKALRRQINAYRAEKGKGALKMNKSLKSSAHKQAVKMMEDGRFDPVADHSTSAQMTSYAKKANCSGIAEIIASTIVLGSDTLDAMMRAWKDSPTHNSIMLAKKWKKIGTGVHVDGDGHLWAVALFCKPA